MPTTVLLLAFLAAPSSPAASASAVAQVLPELRIPAAAAAGPDFDAVRATDAYLATLSPEARARSDAYFEGGYWLLLWAAMVDVLAAWILLASGLSARMRAFAERRVRGAWLQTAVYGVGLVAAMDVLTFPFALYRDFFRERAYGLLNQGFGGWLGDHVKGALVSVVILAVFLATLYAAIRRARRTWWAWGAGIAVAFVAFLIVIAPVFVAPLFNEYRPLPAGPLRDDILSMARANGVPAKDVFVYDGSRQTNRVTANVSGLGATMRISASDTLLDRSPPETVRAVLGHELGHYVLGHTMVLTMELGLLLVAAFAFLAWGAERVQRRLGARWGVRDVADPAGAPILWALLTVFMLLATPVANGIIRTGEVEADLFGLNCAREPDGFAVAAVQLSEYRKLAPGRLEEILFYDHPSGRARVLAAMRWKAEHLRELGSRAASVSR